MTWVAGLLAVAVALLLPVQRRPSKGQAEASSRAARTTLRDVRRRDRDVAADLPHLVGLLGDALRSGQPPATALAQVVDALPGAAAERLGPIVARLRIGMDPADVWSTLDQDVALAPLGRAMARAATTGASVVETVDHLAVGLADRAREAAETRARSVGVRAAVPLGLCLLPAFILLGIVPVVAVLMSGLTG